jgi:hypothetical protein
MRPFDPFICPKEGILEGWPNAIMIDKDLLVFGVHQTCVKFKESIGFIISTDYANTETKKRVSTGQYY